MIVRATLNKWIYA